VIVTVDEEINKIDWRNQDEIFLIDSWIFEGLLGWITLGLFVVTLTNVMMRP
jgi:hypothetical protein